jgi:hypothetical protein
MDYGVMLDGASLDVDKAATDAERERRRQPAGLIDRGPGFDEVEARWRAARTQ